MIFENCIYITTLPAKIMIYGDGHFNVEAANGHHNLGPDRPPTRYQHIVIVIVYMCIIVICKYNCSALHLTVERYRPPDFMVGK